jgi:hypothetical protein
MNGRHEPLAEDMRVVVQRHIAMAAESGCQCVLCDDERARLSGMASGKSYRDALFGEGLIIVGVSVLVGILLVALILQ